MSGVGVLAFTGLWVGKFDIQLCDLHLHPAAETALEVQNCVSQVAIISSGQYRSSEVVTVRAEEFGTGSSCYRVHLETSPSPTVPEHTGKLTESRQPGTNLPTTRNVHC